MSKKLITNAIILGILLGILFITYYKCNNVYPIDDFKLSESQNLFMVNFALDSTITLVNQENGEEYSIIISKIKDIIHNHALIMSCPIQRHLSIYCKTDNPKDTVEKIILSLDVYPDSTPGFREYIQFHWKESSRYYLNNPKINFQSKITLNNIALKNVYKFYSYKSFNSDSIQTSTLFFSKRGFFIGFEQKNGGLWLNKKIIKNNST